MAKNIVKRYVRILIAMDLTLFSLRLKLPISCAENWGMKSLFRGIKNLTPRFDESGTSGDYFAKVEFFCIFAKDY